MGKGISRSSFFFLVAASVLAGYFAFTRIAYAAPGPQLQWQKSVNVQQNCANLNPDALIINVLEDVLNDVDSGFHGNWAIDNYRRHIMVFANADDSFCASLTYEGEFQPQAGALSPGPGAAVVLIGGKDNGHMQGGYVMYIEATLLDNPTWPTRGVVGPPVDYGCNLSGSTCQYTSWLAQYFENITVSDQEWWGWIYRAGKYGTWVNAIDGSPGNIQ